MAVDLLRFETLCSRLPIRDRDTGYTVPFLFSPSQQHIQRATIEGQRRDMPLQAILYKSRRTGGSTWGVALLIAHCLSKPDAKAAIIAQLDSTAKELYDERAVPFAQALQKRGINVEITKTDIRFHFPNGKYSRLYRATAKTVIGGRGLTASAVLLSEAAFYPGDDSFVAILNAISKDPDNIIIIETTPNGIEGPGEVFFNYWNDAIEGANSFIPIFMPWHEDPGLSLPEDMAADAPKDEYEEWLMKEFGCTKGQIAWYRWAMATKCAGSHDKMKQENPSTPDEGFIASGTPAFDSDEQTRARHCVLKPLCRGSMFTYEDEATPEFKEQHNGNIFLWEYPQPDDPYFVGVDAAKGVGTGDFAAIVGWNGRTGDMAFRFADRLAPESAAYFVNGLCRWYNNAMVNIEFTGGWGYIIAKELRDRYYYPTQYLWRSRDESIEAKPRKAMGWETTDRTRRMLIDLYRTSLRRRECSPCDEAFVQQMSRASMELGWRWTVIKGHDDIFMAGMLGWVAREQYYFPKFAAKGTNPNTQENALNREGATVDPGKATLGTVRWVEDKFTTAGGMLLGRGSDHLKFLDRYNAAKRRGDPLEGV